ncbi:type I toxin-antitoxin system SymE family toxin [Serratia quinivorans]|uniref:type I toxin-antitoxin system SymE family toxin n=1 Tax=Serratia quinivorans TaxID=137545 RepID=UPI00217C50E8|nr:type I toxin-antitoxin system SymE family toxin [Serratia quinivorans]CAI1020586.1 HSP20-like domain of uncharacterised function (DUF1813) [Serratia quinivorans]CAI1023059.1 HSP20-like domain of uncharacterised function (DUF1813) [Serratia quinivorans]CAI1890085.1 HSP20-like domain of uncharacterised function (DUF1813) [Serratia quinivorans]CAI2117828.1 HSP20-like domain of uncharacterised function (DUF1813) [Serratia quinivorans]CAI2150756.1 HSP20-like domain of uncharacterised function (D
MNITFTPEPIPELTLSGSALAELGFGIGTPLQLTLRSDGLWLTIVTDDATWNELCVASQHRPDLGADWVRQNGELVIVGDWLTGSGITNAEQLEITAAPGVIRLRRREVEGF